MGLRPAGFHPGPQTDHPADRSPGPPRRSPSPIGAANHRLRYIDTRPAEADGRSRVMYALTSR